MEQDCIFCKIVNREIPGEVIYEDDSVMSFMDIRPVSRGHTLVVPKKHTKDVLEVDEKDLHKVILAARKISHAVMKATNAEGFTISTNRGEAAGQTVFHLHFHIIPRYSNDGLKPWTHQESEPKTRADIAKKIKELL